MKKMSVFILLIGLIVLCNRQQPGSDPVIPGDIGYLQAIAEYQTSIPEPSGLAYNWKTKTFWVVADGNSTVFEMDSMGGILRSMTIPSSDLEGIALSKNCDTMVVVEEGNQLVSWYLMNGTKISSFAVKVAVSISNALEGITIDQNNHLIVLNEKNPMMLLEFADRVELSRMVINYSTDISDIDYDETDDTYWLISDESRKVMHLSRTGALLGQWNVSFLKGEGIAVVGRKIYIVNDSDSKLYVFSKP